MKMRSKANSNQLRYTILAVLLFVCVDVCLRLKQLSSCSGESTSSMPAESLRSAAAQQSREDADTPDHPQPACQEYVLYYKPPKTGSTALTDAARLYVAKMGHLDYRCGLLSCGPYAEGVCTGRLEKRQLLGHLSSNYTIVNCLKRKGYYVVTSNREPMERWRSAWRYNIQHKKSHYGIPWTVGYEEWMSKVPSCVLLNYYDGRGKVCGSDEEVKERIDDIVSMVDEVVDLYEDEYQGDLHKEIVPFLGESNVSDVGNRTLEYTQLPKEVEERLNAERMLYRALKERSKMAPKEGRKLCVKDINKDEAEDVEG